MFAGSMPPASQLPSQTVRSVAQHFLLGKDGGTKTD
jgi:hypothetical protein